MVTMDNERQHISPPCMRMYRFDLAIKILHLFETELPCFREVF